MTTEAGLKTFGEELMNYADICIARLKEMNAQGIIVWDIEGQQYPHYISYIGDPRQIGKLSPEMDRFSDAFMKRFLDAGLKTGISIRPTEVFEQFPGKQTYNRYWHREVKDPVALMSEKIAYARKRWGCTIFYLDSNVFGEDFLSAEQKKSFRGVPFVMPTAMIAALQKQHPDCLIIPEWSNEDYYQFSAPYSSPNSSARSGRRRASESGSPRRSASRRFRKA